MHRYKHQEKIDFLFNRFFSVAEADCICLLKKCSSSLRAALIAFIVLSNGASIGEQSIQRSLRKAI